MKPRPYSAGRFWRVPGLKGNSQIQASSFLYVVLALMLLYVPLEWLFAAFLAGLTHEAFHMAAVKLCGGRIRCLRLGAGGAVMSADDLEGWRQPVCLLAGPLGGLSLLLVARWLPRTAFCAFVHSLYNLLPGDRLDGGRILRWLTGRFLTARNAEKLFRWVQNAFCACIFLAGLLGTFIFRLGWSFALFAAWLVYRVCSSGHNFSVGQENTCKEGKQIVQ